LRWAALSKKEKGGYYEKDIDFNEHFVGPYAGSGGDGPGGI
jgi:hypothetical protein